MPLDLGSSQLTRKKIFWKYYKQLAAIMLALKLPSLPPAPPPQTSSSEMRHPQQQQQQIKPPSLIHCRKNNNSLETSSSEEDLTAAAEDKAAAAAAALEVMDQFETTSFIPRSSSLEASSRVLGGHAESVPEEDEEEVSFIMAVWCKRNKEMF